MAAAAASGVGAGRGAIAALCPRVGLAPYRAGNEAPRGLIKPSRTNVHQPATEIFLVRFEVLILSLLCGLAGSAAAQIGAVSPSKETDRFRAPNTQIECGPIGCRPLPSGCRQVKSRRPLDRQQRSSSGLRQ